MIYMFFKSFICFQRVVTDVIFFKRFKGDKADMFIYVRQSSWKQELKFVVENGYIRQPVIALI